MEDLKLIRRLIGLKLVESKNDINISDIIMSYIQSNCEVCDKVCLKVDLTEIHIKDFLCVEDSCENTYHVSMPLYNTVFLCQVCVRTNVCVQCSSFVCSNCQEEYLIHCDVDDCNKIFCYSCVHSLLYKCKYCDMNKCCQGIFNFPLYGESNHICKSCMDEYLFYPALIN